MTDLFYRAFEDKFRGSRSLIISRLDTYRTFISPLKKLYPDAQGLDLGCGRGEWLELLQTEGIEPMGVDQDEGMLQACRELHLPTVRGDAVTYLTSLKNESQTVVSAFHLVEHISFEQLQLVVSESLRVLKPGGLLIMETPNPENIIVGTQNFYIDPTHKRPIPSLLLSFLTEYYGYARTKVLRLQESGTLFQNPTLGLHDILGGVSPDYAVIAQKNATAGVLEKFDNAFAREYGLSLETLSAHYDAGVKSSMETLQTRFGKLEARVNSALAKVDQSAATLGDFTKREEIRAREAKKQTQTAQVRMQIAETLASQNALRAVNAEALLAETSRNYEHSLKIVYASHSWRTTAPLRWLSFQMQLLKNHGLRARISALARKLTQPNEPKTTIREHISSTITSTISQEDERLKLTPRARQIYKMILASKLGSIPE